MRSYLGLDIGTSGCKAAVFDQNGRMVWLARRDYDLALTSDGRAELDSDIVVQRCLAAMAEVRAQVGGNVRAIAVDQPLSMNSSAEFDLKSAYSLRRTINRRSKQPLLGLE